MVVYHIVTVTGLEVHASSNENARFTSLHLELVFLALDLRRHLSSCSQQAQQKEHKKGLTKE